MKHPRVPARGGIAGTWCHVGSGDTTTYSEPAPENQALRLQFSPELAKPPHAPRPEPWWRIAANACLRHGRDLPIDDLGFISSLSVQRGEPTPEQLKGLKRIMWRLGISIRWGVS